MERITFYIAVVARQKFVIKEFKKIIITITIYVIKRIQYLYTCQVLKTDNRIFLCELFNENMI